ncbi:MAG: hypothetical protein ABGZ35_17885 [Planctomycetaceae bacterium]
MLDLFLIHGSQRKNAAAGEQIDVHNLQKLPRSPHNTLEQGDSAIIF